MNKEEEIFLNMQETKKASICFQIASGSITIKQGSKMAEMSYRQMKRIWKTYKQQGAKGLAHGNRGKKSNRAFPAELSQKMISRYKEHYRDCGPTLAVEFLEREGYPSMASETFRKWLKKQGIGYHSRKVKTHRSKRQRKAHFGDMIQFDGSYHDWFEGRYEKCWLMVMIDDATNIVYAQFTGPEGVKPAMKTVWAWVERYGCPRLLYCDRKNCYVTLEAKTIEEQLENKPHYTDFTRACSELGITVINANSPQAKGRVERINGILQDRLVKELRYAKIDNPQQANEYLVKTFLPDYNKKFSKPPLQKEDHHKKLNKKIKLQEVFTYQQTRVVQNDWCIQYKNRKFQLLHRQPCKITPRRKVIIAEQLDGGIHIIFDKHKLNFKEIHSQPRGHFYVGQKEDISIVA